MSDLDGLSIYLTDSQVAEASRAANWPAARAAMPDPGSDPEFPLESATQMYRGIFGAPFEPASQTFYRTLTQRRAVAVMLAVRLYRLDHDGHLPARLQELVPNYLPAVPLDPMAAEGRPLAYRPDLVPPIIYSVGDNGKDDGGTYIPGSLNRWASSDAVFELEPAPTRHQRKLRTTSER